jgi:hypothetical protein
MTMAERGVGDIPEQGPWEDEDSEDEPAEDESADE